MGGLPRRATFITQEKAEGTDTLILDSGNLIADKPLAEPSLEPAQAKARLILKAMDRMGYAAVAIGEKDLYLGLDRLRSLSDMTKVRFLSANLTDNKGKSLFEPYRLLKGGAITVGAIGLTAPPIDKRMFSKRMPGAVVKDPLQSARETVERIRGKCDLIVLLSNMGYSKDLELAETVPGIDVIISGGTRRFMRKPVIQKKTLITSGFYEGRAVGRLLIHLDGDVTGWISRKELEFLDKQARTAQAQMETAVNKSKLEDILEKRESADELTLYEPDMVNLDPSIPDDPQVAGMISDYRKGLIKSSVSSPGPATLDKEQVHYTGAKTCAGCHESRYRFWLTTDHSRAFDSLAPKNAGADPDCIGCHVTGYMRRTGYWPKAPREDLRGVQCEACHGVGSLHVGSPDQYSLLHLPVAPQCMDCHTESQDDDFDYFRDRPLVCSEGMP
jgi:hypothetical protein